MPSSGPSPTPPPREVRPRRKRADLARRTGSKAQIQSVLLCTQRRLLGSGWGGPQTWDMGSSDVLDLSRGSFDLFSAYTQVGF